MTPVVYPQARLEFCVEPALSIVPEDILLVFLEEPAVLGFNADPAIVFDFMPFSVQIVPADAAALFNEDNGEFLFNEDNGQSLVAEEAT